MNISVKNMVCHRCILAVEGALKDLNLEGKVEMGQVHFKEEINPQQLDKLERRLVSLGFELLKDREKQLIEEIKGIIRNRIARLDLDTMTQTWSDLISDSLTKDYSRASRLFTSQEGITIEHYIISQKIEKAKELIVYGEKPLKEVAALLGYSSTAHLSTQFKNVTGMTISQFREQGHKKRKPLDQV